MHVKKKYTALCVLLRLLSHQIKCGVMVVGQMLMLQLHYMDPRLLLFMGVVWQQNMRLKIQQRRQVNEDSIQHGV